MNIYLTLYCRRLRPDIQIISRATRERNVSTLHRAGADFVLSYASMGALAILNFLRSSGVLMLAEGLHISETDVPPALAGRTLAEAAITRRTGSTVVALRTGDSFQVNPEPDAELPADGRIIFIGTSESEERFLALYEGTSVTRKKVIPLDPAPVPSP